MLTALRIQDFATLEEAELTFGPGLTVLTGETGAGKSLLVGALGLLLGGRSDADGVRAGAEEACIEGLFARTPPLAARLAELGLPDLGEEISVRRVVHHSGRGKVYVNGALVTVGVLTRLMHGLCDVAGQLEQVGIFSSSEHRALLDRVGHVGAERIAYVAAYTRLRALDQALLAVGGSSREEETRVELLAFQLQELETLCPRLGEEEALEHERRRLADGTRLLRIASEAEALLSSDEGAALEHVARAGSLLREALGSDPTFAPLVQRLTALSAEVEDVARGLAQYARGVEIQPERLADVDERLSQFRRLCRKLGTNGAGLVERQQTLRNELAALSTRDERRAQLLEEQARAQDLARAAARRLSTARTQAAKGLAEAVTHALTSLAMPRGRLEIQVLADGPLGPEGADEVQFLFSANAGEPPRPLSRVASGGEASRLLLALRRHLMESDEGFACVLDEADAGVSGAVADGVGQLMKEVARHRQVLCITHLPQVAAYGDAHWVVEKREAEGRTRSSVRRLQGENARTQELARMLSGRKVTREALGAAEALVRSASPGVQPHTQGVRGAARARRSA
jgi:DNA repair protein RecN (Recombination protein N)